MVSFLMKISDKKRKACYQEAYMSYLGKYTQMPAAFEKLLVLEKELESDGYSLD